MSMNVTHEKHSLRAACQAKNPAGVGTSYRRNSLWPGQVNANVVSLQPRRLCNNKAPSLIFCF